MEDNAGQGAGENSSIPGNTSPASRGQWATRPWPLLAFLAATGFITSLASFAIAEWVVGLMNANMEYYGKHPYIILLLDCMEYIFTIASTLCVYFFIRNRQSKHGYGGDAPWKTGAAFWVGIALLAGYITLRSVMMFPKLGNIDGAYRAAFIDTDIVDIFIYFIACVISGMSVLSVSLYFPVLERRLGAIRASLAAAAFFTACGAATALVESTADFLSYPAGIHATFWDDALSPALISLIARAATVMMCIALFLVSRRRIPGAWALRSSIAGFISLLTQWLTSLFPLVDPSEKQIIFNVSLNIVIFAISLGIIWGFQRWKTFGSFLGDFKAFVRKTDI